MLLSERYKDKASSLNEALNLLQADTALLADKLYSNGWTVIGSKCKAPKITGWHRLSKEELKAKADLDFKSSYLNFDRVLSFKANSITLRLADNGVIALDCDFHNKLLTDSFINTLRRFLLSDKPLYTCAGAKGCKVFFKYVGDSEDLPRDLGQQFIDPHAPQGKDNTQHLEVKSNISAVFGVHSFLTNDVLLYGPYIDPYGSQYKHISEASPSDLIELNRKQLRLIEQIYLNLCASYDLLASTGKDHSSLANGAYYRLIKGALCAAGALSLDKDRDNKGDEFSFFTLSNWLSLLGLPEASRVARIFDPNSKQSIERYLDCVWNADQKQKIAKIYEEVLAMVNQGDLDLLSLEQDSFLEMQEPFLDYFYSFFTEEQNSKEAEKYGLSNIPFLVRNTMSDKQLDKQLFFS